MEGIPQNLTEQIAELHIASQTSAIGLNEQRPSKKQDIEKKSKSILIFPFPRQSFSKYRRGKAMPMEKLQIIETSSLDELHRHGMDKASVAIGVFDGLHLGHRHLLGELASECRRNRSSPIAVTFFPHPRSLLNSGQAIGLLLPHRRKVELLHQAGMKAVVTIAFTEEFAELSPERFLDDFLSPEKIRLLAVFVGSGWRFGHGGKGSTATLAKFANGRGFLFRKVEELKLSDAKISSSAIRRAVANGDLEAASRMLGRPYGIYGKVGRGLSFATKGLGFPTANLDVGEGIIPPEGVYSGSAIVAGVEHPAAISIGTAQSVRRGNKQRHVLVEAHILDFQKDIYGEDMEIRFGRYVREQRYFSDTAKLKEQIKRDVEFVRHHQPRFCVCTP
jgi:riboflavin kinase/FMN adenylyltransferase